MIDLNKLNEVIYDIEGLVEDEHENPFVYAACLTEEVGELSEAILVEDGYKEHKTLKEPAVNEAVDCVITALATYFSIGGDRDELTDILELKVNKWKQNTMGQRSGKGLHW